MRVRLRFAHNPCLCHNPPTMLFYQILTIIVFSGLILLAVLAFIEPGPLKRRSRNRRGDGPVNEDIDSPEAEN